MKKVLGPLLVIMALFALVASAAPPVSTPPAANKAAKATVTAAELGLSDALANYLKANDLEPLGLNEHGHLLTWSAAHNSHVIITDRVFGHPWFAEHYGVEGEESSDPKPFLR